MADDSLVFTLARRRVDRFSNASSGVPAAARAGGESCVCEAFLQHGIDTYRWLRWAERLLREADAEGLFAFDAAARQALLKLYQDWFETAAAADAWTQAVESRGLAPPNLSEFRSALEDAADVLERGDWLERTTHARTVSALDEDW